MNTDELIERYGQDYLNEVGSDWEDYIHEMDDLKYYLESEDLNWLLNRMYFGGQYLGDFRSSETFNPNADYYVVNAYGNFFSIDEYYINEWVKEKVEYLGNGIEEFLQWCEENGYTTEE